MKISPLTGKPVEASPLVNVSGTEDVYKIYAESFRGADHLHRILEEAQAIVNDALAVGASPETALT